MAKICKIYPDIEECFNEDFLWQLYRTNLKIQNTDYVKSMKITTPECHALEFGTIKLSCSRRSGHTRSIVYLSKYLEGEWLFFSHNACSVNQLRLAILNELRGDGFKHNKHMIINNQLIQTKNQCFNFYSYPALEKNKIYFGNHKFKGVICDIASTLSKTIIDRIYKLQINMSSHPTQHFIFVG